MDKGSKASMDSGVPAGNEQYCSFCANDADAGSLMPDAEQQRDNEFPRSENILQEFERQQLIQPNEDTGETILVKKFDVRGATKLSQNEIDDALVAYTGKKLTLSQINSAAYTLTQTYHQAGD